MGNPVFAKFTIVSKILVSHETLYYTQDQVIQGQDINNAWTEFS